MGALQKLEQKSGEVSICHKQLFPTMKIENFSMEQKSRMLSYAQLTTNNGVFWICYKLNKLIIFIFISMLIVTFGLTAYDMLGQDDGQMQWTSMDSFDGNNAEDFIDISQLNGENQESMPNHLKYRVRRGILEPPFTKNMISKRQNNNMKRKIERLKKVACKARHDYCQNMFAWMQNDVNNDDKAMKNLGASVDLLNDKHSSDYVKCLECRRIEQHSVNHYQSNESEADKVLGTNNENDLNEAEQNIHHRTINRNKIKTNRELIDVINDLKGNENAKDFYPINGYGPSQNNPQEYHSPIFKYIADEDVLTGPGFLNEMSTRDNRDTVEKTDYAKMLNNGTKVDVDSSKAQSSQADLINPRVLSDNLYHQSGQNIVTNPQILPTAETVKTGQQLQLTSPILPYPVCFYGVPPGNYLQARQQSPIIFPSALPHDNHPSSPSDVPGQGQGFVPVDSSNDQSPYVQQFEHPPQVTAGAPSFTGYYGQKVWPTGPGQQFSNALYQGPLYCTFMPTFQFPTVPGDYQRSSGPAYDSQNIENLNPNSGDNEWRSGADTIAPSYIAPISQENTLQCKNNYHQCLDQSLCISRSQWCDGKVDCADASDEIRCSCKDRIAKGRLCDGYFDCPHGEDELGCFSCPPNAFNCEDWNRRNSRGNCLTLSQRCDGIMQCRNGKDEKDCSALMDEDVDDDDIFSVGFASGYLYKNYRGKWYPACTPTKEWAVESCASETGDTSVDQLPPQILQVPLTQNRGQFISKLKSGQIELVPECNNQVIFVTCPGIPCGTRVSSDSDRYRSYSRFEDVLVALPHLNFTRNESNDDGTHKPSESEEMEDILSQQEELSVDSRVVGGRASQPKAWPSIVAIYKDGYYKCGGTILSEDWILSAAHCLEKHYMHYYRIAAGLLRRFSFSPMEQSRRAEFIIIHPEYYPPLKIYDLGLIKLNEPLRFNRWIRPICLPDYSLVPKPGEMCTTVGWGSTAEHGPEPDHLREVEVPILSSCKHPSDKIEAVICAAKAQGGKDACQGDSGGPLMCKVSENGEQWYIGGIVSHGIGCARPDEPGAYTNVNYFSPWINETIRDKRTPVGPKPLEKCPGFSCDSGFGKCLPKHRRCDKNVDCMDAEDEINCPQNETIDQSSFRTNSDDISKVSNSDNRQNESYPVFEGVEVWTKKSTIELGNVPISEPTSPLINSTSSADDSKDVIGIDEINTTIQPSSVTDNSEDAVFFEQLPRFTCTRLVQSIPMEARCNKVIDCEDGTDEINCTCKDILRNVYPAAICNGRVDCYDLTDEDDCIFCGENEYVCIRSGTCIPLSEKCNNHVDCPLGEDELDCFSLYDRPLRDPDNRLALGVPASGTIIKEVNGTWRTYCSENPDNNENLHIVEQVCQYLGFKGTSWIDTAGKLNLTPLNPKDFDETGSEFVVWGKNSEFELLTEKGPNECEPIKTECNQALITPANSYLYRNTEEPEGSYMWPWQGAMLVDGKYHCPVTLLNDQWLLTSLRCTENIDLDINATTVLAGLSPAYKHVPGPYEQLRNVSIIKPMTEFDVSLLKVYPYPLFRYVQPIFTEERFSAASEHDECFAIGTDPKFNTTTIPIQSAPDSCPPCARCFERPIRGDECKNGTRGNWSGIVNCRGSVGWYPAAVFENKDIVCGFQTTQSLMSIEQMFPHLIDAMDGQYLSHELPHCDGVRCDRGKCIPWEKVCDGIQDCEMGEDELTSYCEEKQNLCRTSSSIECGCSKSELKCHSGECKPKEMFCDGKEDCSDGSDEPKECNCGEFLKLTAPERICDNIRHCYDKTDENQCNCTENTYRCVNSNESDECIPYDYICDGDKDCMNGEDEAVCRMIRNNPNSREFAGEVLHRNYGIWHTECFPAPIQNDSQAQEICQSFGHSDGKVVTFQEARPYGPASSLEFDDFFMIRLSDTWAITTRKAKPLVKLVRATDECHRAFVKCS